LEHNCLTEIKAIYCIKAGFDQIFLDVKLYR